MGSRPPRSANKAQPGATSFGRTWMCWQARTSLRWKYSRGGAWRRCVLFFIHLGNRRVSIAGITNHPDAMAMEQMARNATMEELGCLHPCRYLLHDRDTKFCESFREVLKAGGVKPLKLPARSPNLNAFAERWVRSITHL